MKIQIALLITAHAQLASNRSPATQEDDHRHHPIRVIELANGQTIGRQLSDGKTRRIRLLFHHEQQRLSSAIRPLGQQRHIQLEEAVPQSVLGQLFPHGADDNIRRQGLSFLWRRKGQRLQGIVKNQVLEVLVVAHGHDGNPERLSPHRQPTPLLRRHEQALRPHHNTVITYSTQPSSQTFQEAVKNAVSPMPGSTPRGAGKASQPSKAHQPSQGIHSGSTPRHLFGRLSSAVTPRSRMTACGSPYARAMSTTRTSRPRKDMNCRLLLYTACFIC